MSENEKFVKNNEVTFSQDFEEKILQAILSDSHFGEQIFDVLEPAYFDSKYIQELSRIVKKYYEEYKSFPTPSLLQTICVEEVSNDVLKKQCNLYLDKIKSKPLNGDSGYVKDRALSFFRTQSVKKALAYDVLPRLEKENLDEIMPFIQQALLKGTNKNIGYEYHEDTEERFVEEKYDKVPTPWEPINQIFNGGIGAKRLFTLIGPSGGAKSHFLVNIGSAALMNPKEDGRGRTVVHYTLELTHVDVARRYDACMTGVSINDVIYNKEKILFTLKNKLPKESKLIIKEYPMKTASVQTIRGHLSKLKLNGIEPDIIIIDYGDLLLDETETRGALWISMKTLAQELNVPVVTVTQTNRIGFDCEIVTLDMVAEDFQKVMHSDIIMTISHHKNMYIGKNRQGYDKQVFPYKIDTGKSKFELLEQNTGTIQELKKALTEPKENVEFSALDSYIKKNGTQN